MGESINKQTPSPSDESLKIETKRRKASRVNPKILKSEENKMTNREKERQARNHYKAWERSEDYALEFVYKSFSANKARHGVIATQSKPS